MCCVVCAVGKLVPCAYYVFMCDVRCVICWGGVMWFC